MATLTPEQTFALLIQAGFSPAGATTMTAIAGPESGYDDKNRGDVNIQNAVWGPSVGLFQERTLKAETGKGTVRDINWLLASDANQAKAAWVTSSSGKDFHPWSTYNDGKYLKYLPRAGQAALAVAASGPGKFLTGIGGAVGGAVSTLPGVSAAGDIVATVVAPLIDGLRKIGVTGAFAVAGVGLIVGGGFMMARPYLTQAKQQLVETGVKVAKVAVP